MTRRLAGLVALARVLLDNSRRHQEEVGVAGLLASRSQQCVDLAAVVGLVIEEVGDRRRERLRDVCGLGDRPIGEGVG